MLPTSVLVNGSSLPNSFYPLWRTHNYVSGKSGSGSITKTHTGQYRNSIAYAITVHPKQQIIRGNNQSSVFVLERLSASTSKSTETGADTARPPIKLDPLLSSAQYSPAASTIASSTASWGLYQNYSNASQLAGTSNYASSYFDDSYTPDTSQATAGPSNGGTQLTTPTSSNSKDGKFRCFQDVPCVRPCAFFKKLSL